MMQLSLPGAVPALKPRGSLDDDHRPRPPLHPEARGPRNSLMFTPTQHAAFNAWANERLHAACAMLGEERLRADHGAFFK